MLVLSVVCFALLGWMEFDSLFLGALVGLIVGLLGFGRN